MKVTWARKLYVNHFFNQVFQSFHHKALTIYNTISLKFDLLINICRPYNYNTYENMKKPVWRWSHCNTLDYNQISYRNICLNIILHLIFKIAFQFMDSLCLWFKNIFFNYRQWTPLERHWTLLESISLLLWCSFFLPW